MVAVIGHRGAAGVAPENTLESFGRAIELGVAAVECDVRLSRDGHVVVMHDDAADRTTDGSGAIAELDFEAIRRLDAGAGQRVPALDEVLDAVAGRCDLLCELKAEGAAASVGAAARRQMLGEVVFLSFRFDFLEEARRRAGDARIGALLAVPRSAEVERAAAMGCEFVGVHYRNVSLAAVAKAHEQGMRMNVWTPNELWEMQAMIALGADTITTDRPDILLEHLKTQQL